MVRACALVSMRGAPSEGRRSVLTARLSAHTLMDALIRGARLFGHAHMVSLASVLLPFGFGYFHRLRLPPMVHFVYGGFVSLGGFDKRGKETVVYLEELGGLAESEDMSDRVNFVMSCSTADRNVLLSDFSLLRR